MYYKSFILFIIILSTNLIAQTIETVQIEKQTNKQTFSIAGDMYYSYNSREHSDYHQLRINPNIGYFMWNNIMLGLNLVYDYSRQDYDNNRYYPDHSSSFFLVGPSIEFYMNQTVNQPFIRVGFLTGGSFNSNLSSAFSIAGGYSIQISKNIAIQPALQYMINKDTSTLLFGIGIKNFIY